MLIYNQHVVYKYIICISHVFIPVFQRHLNMINASHGKDAQHISPTIQWNGVSYISFLIKTYKSYKGELHVLKEYKNTLEPLLRLTGNTGETWIQLNMKTMLRTPTAVSLFYF